MKNTKKHSKHYSTRYESREEALYFSRCVQRLANQFLRLANIDAAICGFASRYVHSAASVLLIRRGLSVRKVITDN